MMKTKIEYPFQATAMKDTRKKMGKILTDSVSKAIKEQKQDEKKIYENYLVKTKLVRNKKAPKVRILNTMDTFDFLKSMQEEDRERFVGIYLDARNTVLGTYIISMGTADSSIAHPREVFKPAILMNALRVIIAHNHPSGGVEPSKDDIKITKKLKHAGKILGIELLDHIIIGDNQYESIIDRN